MFESSVLVFQLPQSSCIAAVHPLVLGPPLLERPRMNSNPPRHLVDRNGSCLDLLDASDDLLLAVPRLARHSLLLLYRTAVPALSVEQFSGSRPARRRRLSAFLYRRAARRYGNSARNRSAA